MKVDVCRSFRMIPLTIFHLLLLEYHLHNAVHSLKPQSPETTNSVIKLTVLHNHGQIETKVTSAQF